MQHTRTTADRHHNGKVEDVHAESIVIWELSADEEGMEQARVVQIHESLLFTPLGSSNAHRTERIKYEGPCKISDWAMPK